MAITLGTFQNLQISDLIIESYERVGVTLPEIIGNNKLTAINSLNIILTDWARYNNLYSIQPFMIQLIDGQKTYPLPVGTADIPEREVTVAQITRNLGGTPAASSGVAANAFDGSSTTACVQNAINGNISYHYNNNPGYAINYIGIQSNITTSYHIYIEYSYDGTNWLLAVDTGAQIYTAGLQVWFVNVPALLAPYWRIRETGGGTLNIQEVYFDTHNISRQLSLMSRSQYIGIANKNNQSSVSSYYFERQQNPYITMWPVPTIDYPYLILNLKILNPKIISLTQQITLPSRFYQAIHACLASALAEKDAIIGKPLDPGKKQEIYAKEQAALANIEQEDTEHAPIQLVMQR